MKAYLDLLKHVMENGRDRGDRTGTGTRSVFDPPSFRHDLQDGFPLLTTKKLFTKAIVAELIWFLSGSTNIKFLKDNGVTIWDEWADEHGDLGPVYGSQWRFWTDPRKLSIAMRPFAEGSHGTIDQIENLIKDLKTNPNSRRHIVTAWNPSDVPFMKLPPCHSFWQCYVREEEETENIAGNIERYPQKFLDLKLYARSIDTFLGLPFNIASYALLLSILAQVVGMKPGRLGITFGDLHIYQNHFDQVSEQLARTPGPLPRLVLAPRTTIDWWQIKDVTFEGYEAQPSIKAPISV